MLRVRELSKRDDFLWPIQFQFNKLFDEFFSNKKLDASKHSVGYPKMDIFETKNKWVIQVAIPGVDPDLIGVEITPENTVRIYGEMTEKRLPSNLELGGKFEKSPARGEHYEAIYYMKELRRSKFEREIYLPENLAGEPEAIVKDGMLTLSWDFEVTEEEPEPKLVEIKRG